MTFSLPSSIMLPSNSSPPRRHINLAIIMWIVPHSFCPNSLFPLIWPSSLSSDLPEAAWALGLTQEICVCLPLIRSIGNPGMTADWLGEGRSLVSPGFLAAWSSRPVSYLSKSCLFKGSLLHELYVLFLTGVSCGANCSVAWSRNLGSLGILRDKQAAGLKVGLGLGLGEWNKLKVSHASSRSFIKILSLFRILTFCHECLHVLALYNIVLYYYSSWLRRFLTRL